MKFANFSVWRARYTHSLEIDSIVGQLEYLQSCGESMVDYVDKCRVGRPADFEANLFEWLRAVDAICLRVVSEISALQEEIRDAQSRGSVDKGSIRRMHAIRLMHKTYTVTLLTLRLNTINGLDHSIISRIGSAHALSVMQMMEHLPETVFEDLALLVPVSKVLPDWIRACIHTNNLQSVVVSAIDGLTNFAYLNNHVKALEPAVQKQNLAESSIITLDFETAGQATNEVSPLQPGGWSVVKSRRPLKLSFKHSPVSVTPLLSNSTVYAAARYSHRTPIFLGSSIGDEGFAIRVFENGTHDAILLPGFDRNAIARLKTLEHKSRDMMAAGKISIGEYYASIWRVLLQIGSLVIEPILDKWSDVSRCTLIPIGTAYGLPYGVTHLLDEYRNSALHLTVCPSARTMLLSALSSGSTERGSGSVFIAGDPAIGPSRIPFVVDELDAVARIWGQQPVIFNRSSNNGDGLHQGRSVRELDRSVDATRYSRSDETKALLQGIGGSDVVHLSCHGRISSDGRPRADLLIGGCLSVDDIHNSGLKPGSLVVLSACSVGGVDGRYYSEVLGFPTVLLGSGGRNLVASIWPVPDSLQTVDLMCRLHDALYLGETAEEAFETVIKNAIDECIPPNVWAGYSMFGT